MKLTDHWVMKWIKKDGLYLITIGLCLLAILSLSNGAEKATAECNEYWMQYYYEQNNQPYDFEPIEHDTYIQVSEKFMEELNNGTKDIN